MTQKAEAPHHEKIFYGWWVVAGAFLVLFLGVCSGFYTVSVFLEPLESSFGWNRTQISLGFTIAALLVGLLSPLVGAVVAKVGVKKVMVFGACLVGCSLFALGFIQSLWQYYLSFIVLAAGISSIGLVPNQTLISHWFKKRRGTAMGIIMTGIGLGGMAMISIASAAVQSFGWRWSYRFLGLTVLCLVLPGILLIIRNRPEDMGLLPDGLAPAAEGAKGSSREIGLTVGESLRSLTFYLLCLDMAFYAIIIGGMTQHAIALLRSLSVSDANLTWSLALGASVAGRLLFGAMADRISRKGLVTLVWAFHLAGIGALLFLTGTGVPLWLFVIFYGMALGAFATLFPLLLGERLGVEHFSKIVGLTGLFNIIGMATGAVLLGRIFDATGSYALAVRILLGIAGAALVVTTAIGRPRKMAPATSR